MQGAYHDRGPLSLKRRMAIGAGMLGIPKDEYRRHVEAGEKWCWGCQSWHPRDAAHFYPRPAQQDGLDNVCKDIVRVRARETMRRLYARRRAERAVS